MPEIKHNFLQGKMNKDLDERLVPNGQYRDALNIEISTSEGSDVGTVQNILGNKHISTTPSNMLGRNIPGEYKRCIGSISDEKNDALYWFIASEEYEDLMSISVQCQIPNLSPGNTGNIVSSSFGNPINTQHGLFQDTLRHAELKDMILEYKDGDITPVFVDKHTIIIKIWDCEGSRSQVDIANDILRPGALALTSSSGFLNNGIGWGFNASTENKIEIMDITGLKVGYTVKGIGTKHDQNVGFIDYFIEEEAAWTTEIINIIPGTVWFDWTGKQRQTGIITLNKTVYPSPLTPAGVNNITHLVFERNILDFSKDRLITGINIIDDMLFWTDNFSEPKKINITRSKEGTHPSGNTQTRLIVDDRNINYNSGVPAEQEHITVIKKPPTSAPILEMKANRSGYSFGKTIYDFASSFVGGSVDLVISPFTTANYNLNYRVGDKLFLKLDVDTPPEFASLRSGDSDHEIRVVINGINGSVYNCSILNITNLSFSSNDFGVALDETAEELFSLKFPRFALRYKYEDGEYSSYGPFSEVAFVTDTYDFHPNKGYNLGMQNQLRELELKKIIPPDTPLDVVQVDILYKETNSPNIYIVEQIKKSTEVGGVNLWNSNSFKVESEVIYAVLPSNQLLRPWDNVPRKALAQEVTGNRLVYANYLQNYNLKDINQKYVNMDFDIWLKERDYFKQSIKSMRTYQLGVVYRDVYGRETPVQTSSNASLKVSKLDADKTNRVVTKMLHNPPAFADSYKIFVKETSNEYYNLPLDRLYNAEDGNVWLSFASHDRNKVKDEDTLILKKSLDGGLVTNIGKYKILDIKNEAPKFIKTRKSVIGQRSWGDVEWTPPQSWAVVNDPSMKDVWPLPNYNLFFINSGSLDNTTLENFQTRIQTDGANIAAPLFVRFFGHDENGNRTGNATGWYEIDNVTRGGINRTPEMTGSGDGHYRVLLKKALGDDAKWINASTPYSVTTPVLTTDSTNGNLVVQFAQEVETENAKFQGRFFVKVLYDTTIEEMVIDPQAFYANKIASINAYHVKDFTEEDPFNGGSFASGNQNVSVTKSSSETAITNFNAHGPGWLGTNPTVSLMTAADSIYYNDHYDDFGPSFSVSSNLSIRQQFDNAGSTHPIGNMLDGGTEGDLYTPHGVPIPVDAYYSRHAWVKIRDTLEATGSKWFIDESFATSEEPYYEVGKTQNHIAHTGNVGGNTSIDNSMGLYVGWNIFSASVHHDRDDFGVFTSDSLNPTTGPFSPHNNSLTQSYYQQPVVRQANGSPFFGLTLDGFGYGPVNFDDTPTWSSAVTPQHLLDQVQDWKFYSEGQGVNGKQIDISYIAPRGDAYTASSTGGGTSISYFDMDNDSLSFTEDKNFADNLVVGKRLVFTSDPQRRVYKIDKVERFYKRNFASFTFDDTYPFCQAFFANNSEQSYINSGAYAGFNPLWEQGYTSSHNTMMEENHIGANFRLTFRLTLDLEIGFNGYTPLTSGTMQDLYGNNQSWTAPTMNTNPVGIEIVDLEDVNFGSGGDNSLSEFPEDPAVWETEPEEGADLDIYYEVTDVLPLRLSSKNNELFASVGSNVELDILTSLGFSMISGFVATPLGLDFGDAKVQIWNGNEVTVNLWLSSDMMDQLIAQHGEQSIKFTRQDGSYITGIYDGLSGDILNVGGVDFSKTFKIKEDVSKAEHGLTWHNCYSFSNGVESNRIRDNYNAVTLDNGVVASSTFEEKFAEERRGSGLIYSGLYNSTSGVNNLNQFIQAEKITKDLNPTYGTIQKLHSRNTDLIALCEDKVLKILANKDAVYNADNNMQLTATQNVLGQSVPFIGEFGISKNPESFASESYRAYFTDKQRGAVLRLSKDGLTNIAEHGMSDWFKDNLKLSKHLIGSHDDRKEDYNITLDSTVDEPTVGETLSFSEIVTGWVSFKSFIPENGISMASNYYTFKNGRLWKHHQPQLSTSPHLWSDCAFENAENYNVFYGVDSYTTTIDVMLNDSPSTIKSFRTLGYEGSQSKVTNFTTTTTTDAAGNILANIGDGEFYNIEPDKKGWFVNNIITDQQKGSIKEFIEKEGLWDNYIIGEPKTTLTIDPEEFSFQGIGIAGLTSTTAVVGCMDILALNYNPAANVDSGNCTEKIIDCMDPNATNYNPAANTQCTGCCFFEGCTDPTMFNYNHQATVDDGSCVPYYYGCMNPTAFNYDEEANTDDGSCIAVRLGCTSPTAVNYNPSANTDDGSCIACVYGCTDNGDMEHDFPGWWSMTSVITTGVHSGTSYSSLNPQFHGSYPTGAVMNYNPNATCDDGSCRYNSSGGGVHGCLDDGFRAWSPIPGTAAENHNCSSSTSPNSLVWCQDNVTNHNWTCIYSGCTVEKTSFAAFYGLAGASNYNVNYNLDDGFCNYPGCMDPTADNYDVDAVFDNGTCTYSGGCTVNGSPAVNTVSVSATITDQEAINGIQTTNGSVALTSNCAGGCHLPYTYEWFIGSTQLQSTVQPLGTPYYDPTTGVLYGPAGTYQVVITDDIGCVRGYSYTIPLQSLVALYGCTDSTALNYNFPADPTHIDNGSCYGCMDNQGPNFCAGCSSDCSNQAGGSDVSCCGFISGCTDSLATNYDPLATGPSTGCTYNGCTDTAANNSGAINHPATGASTGQTRSLASINDDGSCEFWGCLDSNQVPGNYNQCVDGTGAVIACTHDCAGNLTSINTSCCTDCGTFTTQAAGYFQTQWVIPTDATTNGGSDGTITVGGPPGIMGVFYGISLSSLTDLGGTNHGVSSPNGNIISGPESWTGLPAETYGFTITGNNHANSGTYAGCTHTYSVDVNEPASPCALSVTGGTFNSATQDIEGVDVVGGVGALTYVVTYSDATTTTGSITNSTGNAFSGYPASFAFGNVDITVTDAANGCTSTITVTVPTYPCNGTLSETHVDVTTNGGSDGSIHVTASSLIAHPHPYGIQLTGPGGYSSGPFSPTSNPSNFLNLSAGVYTATLIDAINSNCTASITITVAEPNGCGGSFQVKNNASGAGATTPPTITGAINGSGGVASGIYAYNGGSVSTQNASGSPYSVVVTGPGGYTSTSNQVGLGPIANLTNLTNGTYNVTATDNTTNNNGSGCVSPTYSFVVGNTVLILGCTDVIANNYNPNATPGNVNAVSSCTYDCNITVNAVSVASDEACGGDGSFHLQGVSSGNNVVGYDYTITPNPATGTGSTTGSSTTMNVSFGSVHDGSYTVDVNEQNSGAGFPNTGCSASTTFSVAAAVLGCNDSSANNYAAGVTCFTNQQDECCYDVTTSSNITITTNPATSDGVATISINGLPTATSPASAGDAIVKYRVTGFGNASGYFFPGTPSSNSFATLGTSTPVIGGSTTWDNISLTGLPCADGGASSVTCTGNYTLQVYVNGPNPNFGTNNNCTIQSFNFNVGAG